MPRKPSHPGKRASKNSRALIHNTWCVQSRKKFVSKNYGGKFSGVEQVPKRLIRNPQSVLANRFNESNVILNQKLTLQFFLEISKAPPLNELFWWLALTDRTVVLLKVNLKKTLLLPLSSSWDVVLRPHAMKKPRMKYSRTKTLGHFNYPSQQPASRPQSWEWDLVDPPVDMLPDWAQEKPANSHLVSSQNCKKW